MKTHQKFLEFNGSNLLFLQSNGTYWIAVRPICEALNVVYTAQLKRIKKDAILGPAYTKQTMQVPISTQNDRPAFQGREMICLPEMYVYGWVFSINSKSEELFKYKQTCYELLYKHFHGTITNRKELLLERTEIDTRIHNLKESLKEEDEKYKELQKMLTKRKLLTTNLNAIDNELIKEPELFN